MEGASHSWRLTHTPPNGAVTQTEIQIVITGPDLTPRTLNHIIFDIIVRDLFHNFPILYWPLLPEAIILDYPPLSDMLNGMRITLAGHGAGKILFIKVTFCYCKLHLPCKHSDTNDHLDAHELMMIQETTIRLTRGVVRMNITTAAARPEA